MDSVVASLTDPMFVHAVYLSFLFGSAIALLVGLSLASGNATALQAMNGFNHWFSIRKALKPLMMPHMVEPMLPRRPLVLGILIILAAALSIYVLTDIDSEVFLVAFLGGSSEDFASTLATIMKWSLLISNGACLILGALMILAPSLWSRLERFADQWYSLRKLTYPVDKMHTGLDTWVMAHPTVSGIVLAILSLTLGISMYAQLSS